MNQESERSEGHWLGPATSELELGGGNGGRSDVAARWPSPQHESWQWWVSEVEEGMVELWV